MMTASAQQATPGEQARAAATLDNGKRCGQPAVTYDSELPSFLACFQMVSTVLSTAKQRSPACQLHLETPAGSSSSMHVQPQQDEDCSHGTGHYQARSNCLRCPALPLKNMLIVMASSAANRGKAMRAWRHRLNGKWPAAQPRRTSSASSILASCSPGPLAQLGGLAMLERLRTQRQPGKQHAHQA